MGERRRTSGWFLLSGVLLLLRWIGDCGDLLRKSLGDLRFGELGGDFLVRDRLRLLLLRFT